jgi:hypothetical protein
MFSPASVAADVDLFEVDLFEVDLLEVDLPASCAFDLSRRCAAER